MKTANATPIRDIPNVKRTINIFTFRETCIYLSIFSLTTKKTEILICYSGNAELSTITCFTKINIKIKNAKASTYYFLSNI